MLANELALPPQRRGNSFHIPLCLPSPLAEEGRVRGFWRRGQSFCWRGILSRFAGKWTNHLWCRMEQREKEVFTAKKSDQLTFGPKAKKDSLLAPIHPCYEAQNLSCADRAVSLQAIVSFHNI